MRYYKRGEIWWFEFTRDGQRYQRSSRMRNKRTAEQIAEAFRTDLGRSAAGLVERKRAPTFRVAMAEFLAWAVATKKEHPRTAARYQVSSKALLRFFPDVSLTDITSQDLERFRVSRLAEKGSRTGKPLRPATVNREVVCLSAMYRHFKGVAPFNPVRDLKPLPEGNQQDRVLSYAEQRRYLACCTPVLRDVALLMLTTGCRPEEVCSIHARDVNLSERKLKIPNGKTKAARRTLGLTSVGLAVLGERVASHPDGYLFPHKADPARPMPKVNNAHDRAVRDSGVRCKLYSLRHTWATRAVEAGIDLVTLSVLLGHEKTTMVRRYAHPQQSHQLSAMEQIEAHVTARESFEG